MKPDRKNVEHRMKIIKGQVQGLERMVGSRAYCIEILTQSLAIQNALKEIDKIILKNHLKSCIVSQMKNGEETTAIKELERIFSLTKRG